MLFTTPKTGIFRLKNKAQFLYRLHMILTEKNWKCCRFAFVHRFFVENLRRRGFFGVGNGLRQSCLRRGREREIFRERGRGRRRRRRRRRQISFCLSFGKNRDFRGCGKPLQLFSHIVIRFHIPFSEKPCYNGVKARSRRSERKFVRGNFRVGAIDGRFGW